MALSQITWQDVQQLPDDGKRREAIDGELYVTPAPSSRHQRISQRLEQAMIRLLEEPGHAVVAHAPIGVEFPATGEGVQPDIVCVSGARRGVICDEGIRGVTRQLYDRQGVEQYWIVDPGTESVEIWTFGENPDFERFTDRLPARVAGDPVGEIDLPEVFRAD